MNSVYLRYLALVFTFLILRYGQICFSQNVTIVLCDRRSDSESNKHTTPHLRPSLQQCPVFHYVRFQRWQCCGIQSRPVWSSGFRSETPRCCWSHTSKWNPKPCAHLREEHCGLQDTHMHRNYSAIRFFPPVVACISHFTNYSQYKIILAIYNKAAMWINMLFIWL